MIAENKYKKLHNLSVGYVDGKISFELLQKAIEIYGGLWLQNDDNYVAVVSKSFHNYVNSLPQDSDIVKAILPGQTKVVDGVMYIWSPTKSGSKTDYQWHIVKNTKSGKNLSKNNNVSDEDAEQSQKYVNEMFPKELSDLTIVKRLGGSTGAVLAKDSEGNEYVMKKGTNTNNGHVKNEYLTNQLYNILSIKTPDYELYEENGESVLLSKFVPMLRMPGSSDYKKMADGFIADVLLNNWDVYQNDNSMIDAGGRVLRVDNGGALDYKAQGGKKRFDANVMNSFNGMKTYNPDIYSQLTEADISKQIADIKSKKDDIVTFLRESGRDDIADIMSNRIDNLSKITQSLDVVEYIKNFKVKPRNVKSPKEMYRDLTDEELEKIWKDADNYKGLNKRYAESKLSYTDSDHGWKLLNDICELRGFNARPEVVDDDEFWKIANKSENNGLQIFRGLSEDPVGNLTLGDMAESFMYSDICYYGTRAVYGEGIYATGANGRSVSKNDFKNDSAWQEARSYAKQNGNGVVMSGMISPDAKIVKCSDIRKQMDDLYTKLISQSDIDDATKKKIEDLEDECKKLFLEFDKLKSDVDDFKRNKTQQVYREMQYDPLSIEEMYAVNDATNWDYINAFGEREIPSFEEFVEGNMVKWVKAQGGTAKIGKGNVVFELPDSDDQLTIGKLQYDGEHSIKKKNIFTPGYNYAVNKFMNWMEKNKIRAVDSRLTKELSEESEEFKTLRDEKDSKEREYKTRKHDLEDLKNTTVNKNKNLDSSESLLNCLANNRDQCENWGIYAALKGIDVIESDFGPYSYRVILNRSKVIVSNKIETV